NGVAVKATVPQIETTNEKTLLGNIPEPVSSAMAYEISVKAPAGATMAQAMNIFKNEAKKVCGGENYSQQINSSRMEPLREYGMKNVTVIQVPSIKGVVTCNNASDVVAVPVSPVIQN
ncbi:MAG TPA: hypothetical protein DIV86_07400, partial [Alphaproteobacteria bacterium]|nr:hypothetical protein [Alphaproteobacteria bacterium]